MGKAKEKRIHRQQNIPLSFCFEGRKTQTRRWLWRGIV